MEKIEEHPRSFLKLPAIQPDWCNDKANSDGTWGTHTHISWSTNGCGCCSSEVISEPISKENVEAVIAMLKQMRHEICKEILSLLITQRGLTSR
jgi:hypothetical protein